ncbi:hypothetical protein QCA50_004834 [Cerrena zonata]|uniref:Protein kinase domain-containing protein n=1 Tax=Cerrena zonata TaxID=2478898 RepID=A0AAW0GQD3_9APHY
MSVDETTFPFYAVCSPEEVEKFRKRTEEGRWDLTSWEVFWQERYDYLKSQGYLLRPRFKPGWTPSWLGTNRNPHYCEDSIYSVLSVVIDATRLSDGTRVMLKTVSHFDDEIPIGRLLSRDEVADDPTNHCVPVYQLLQDPIDQSKAIIVMKYLRPFDDPELRTVGEVVDFVAQTLEGISFLHRQRVAHRDCAAANIMMDGEPLFPQGHHPVQLDYLEDGMHYAPYLSRQDHPVKYYFIDFGISSYFDPGVVPLVVGTQGRDKEPPELDDRLPYNPFPLDIFILGNLYRKEFVEKYYGFEFLEPLISSMTQREPQRRPTAEAACSMFRKIQADLAESTLRWRLRSRKESVPERVVYDTVAVAREGIYKIRRMIV